MKELEESYDNEIKQIKHQVYKLCWYMRGGVGAETLFYNSDIEDLTVLQRIVEENIDAAKTTGMPLI